MGLYESIEKCIRGHKECLHLEIDTTNTEIRHAIRWVMRDNPDIFWFVHQYHFDKENRIISFRYRCSPQRHAIIQESIDDVVENDFQINYVRTLTQLEQVAYVYKWMLSYCCYNTNSAYNQNIDSVFVRRNSVCTGYAKAAQFLFKLLGIESCLVFGRMNNDKEDGRHCWNIVKIKELYYHLDICLGDVALVDLLKKAGVSTIQRYGDNNYNCFCVSTAEIMKSRSIEDLGTLPACNSILSAAEIESVSRIKVRNRVGVAGCQLTHSGSSADIVLCTKDKNVVLKKFRGNDTQKCEEEYGYMECLKGCTHLLHLNSAYSDVMNNILAMEQSTPIVDLFCSHYYHPTLNGVLKMIKDITLGWLECQQRRIIYRDIHICNVYKTKDGIYKLGDFGSCTYEHSGQREQVGSPWFMSPETYISGLFDERSAVYSLTIVLYFVLNGLRPPFFNGNNEGEALHRKMNGEPLPKPALLHSFPKDLAEVMMTELFERGCAFNPSKRIQTCHELLHIINALCTTIKNQRIELKFSQQDMDAVLSNKSVPNIDISRDIYHRNAYGKDEARETLTLAGPYPQKEIDVVATRDGATAIIKDGDGNFKESLDGVNSIERVRTSPECCDDVNVSSIPMSDDVENYCWTMGCGERPCNDTSPTDYNGASYNHSNTSKRKREINYVPKPEGEYKEGTIGGALVGAVLSPISLIFGGINGMLSGKANKKGEYDAVYSSIFAPAEVKLKSHMIVQVYLHLLEETEKVKGFAKEPDRNAERRDYIPLQCKLKKGDKVDVLLNIYGETLLMSDKKVVVWQGSFNKCSFDYYVPKDIDEEELSCVALLSVNGTPVGEVRFITKIVEHPRQLNPEIIAHKYNKVFVSYSHQDESKVKFLHKGLELGNVPHFFDREYLKEGDVFPKVIEDYINSADLFILCWSKNAAESDYVQKERHQALERAFPKVKPEMTAKLRLYPMSIEPRTELPDDMKDDYHFGTL